MYCKICFAKHFLQKLAANLKKNAKNAKERKNEHCVPITLTYYDENFAYLNIDSRIHTYVLPRLIYTCLLIFVCGVQTKGQLISKCQEVKSKK